MELFAAFRLNSIGCILGWRSSIAACGRCLSHGHSGPSWSLDSGSKTEDSAKDSVKGPMVTEFSCTLSPPNLLGPGNEADPGHGDDALEAKPSGRGLANGVGTRLSIR